MQAGISTRNAPSPSVVLPHYAYGAVAFVIASVLLFFAADDIAVAYLTPRVLSVAHLLILGWITMLIFGALYQLIPVVMEVKLYSEKLAKTSFYLLALGTPLIALSFWINFIGPSHLMMTGGALVILSVLLFVVNALKSAGRSSNKTIENRFIITSVFWLLLTVVLGLGIILFPGILGFNAFPIHLTMGLIGWFMMLVVGVGSTLMPMFFIAHQLNKKLLHAAYWLINGGLAAMLAALYSDAPSPAIIAASSLMLTGFSLFFAYNFKAYQKRLRRKLDIGMKLSVLAFVLLVLALLSGFLASFGALLSSLAFTKISLIYGASLLLGFLTALILGQMYKTLPFIVWLKIYQDKVGKFKTPLPADMHSEEAARAHYYFYIAALVLLFGGLLFGLSILVQVASVFFSLTGVLYAYNTFKILRHKEDLKPLVLPKVK